VSIPLSFFGGIGGASRKGILIKGSNYLEALSQLETVVFAKTGTLTKGVFDVQEIHAQNMERDELLQLAAYAENYCTHPIAASLKRTYEKEIDNTRITEAEEMSGHGVRALIDGKTVLAGNSRLMEKMGVLYDVGEHIGTLVFVAVDGIFAGYIVIADEIKDDAPKAIEGLKENGVKEIVMLTGDAKDVADKVAKDLSLDAAYADLLPGGKVEKIEQLLARKSANKKLAFVGDGINDAPVLARADVGIAMGALGSDAAIEAADIVIMTDELSKISSGIKISKKTIGIVRQNIVFSLAVKFCILMLATLGIAPMWAGVIADVGVTVLAVVNASRALNVAKL